MITSGTNHQMKYLSQLQKKASFRKKEGVFVVEGIKMFLEIPSDRLVKAYVSESFYSRLQQGEMPNVKERLCLVAYEIVQDKVFAEHSDTLTPQGIMAVVRQKPVHDLEQLLSETGEKDKNVSKQRLFILLDGLQDPGNLGTVMRTAEAAGVSAVIMSADTVDIYNPKTIRSTMGAIFRVPFLYTNDLCGVMKNLQNHKFSVFITALQGSIPYTVGTYTADTAFVIGNEANGVKDSTLAVEGCQSIHIPMEGEGESLNAAVAAAIVMYEAVRQRSCT